MSDKPPRYASWTAGKLPLPELLEMKRRGEKIVMVTAYDAPSGRLADAAGVDLILATSKHNTQYLLGGYRCLFFAQMDALGLSRYSPVVGYPRENPAQAFYVGQGYRYRVRTGSTEVWVHAPDRMDEGTTACIAVPRAALMLFPRDSTTLH